ncbi:MAG: nucleotidyl transferase AbiEii/AbiGii toxin family protein [Acidimicrobiaceae bacterium]|nr:nucleotidyl transferase AbiEii/AbiGii toxin family protein [Acidimicrobiaceae bacterium]
MTVQDFDAHTQRDMIQHHVVAALAEIGDDRLVFKGGTLLRVCVFENYRWSEDLDFDWAGSPEGFRALVDGAVTKAASSLGIPTLTTEDAGAVNVNIVAPEMAGPIRAEATVLAERDDSVPTQRWPINPRWGTSTDTAPIRGYTATAVAADKLRCLARRSAPRDIYDLDQLARTPQVDLPVAWNLYTASYNNPAREYGRRNHPADIRSTYLGRRDHIATAWHELQQQGQFPPQADFDETFNRVDRHITELRDTWANSLPPGELHRLLQQHIQQQQQQQSRPDPRRGDLGRGDPRRGYGGLSL